MEIELNDQFKKALELMQSSGKNVFITGRAGTGKSTLLSHFMKDAGENVAVLAPTGVAALNVEGETIHSFFGFRPHVDVEQASKKAHRQTSNQLYTELKTLVVDEISMVRADLMDCMDAFLKIARKNYTQAFGGVQMIFIGDLYQLPPVLRREDKEAFMRHYDSPYFFDAQVFKNYDFEMEFVEFEKVYRQEDDSFVDLLEAIRKNQIAPDHLHELNQRVGEVYDDDDVVYLTATNRAAQKINEDRLEELDAKEEVLEGDVTGELGDGKLPTDLNLALKVGAQVMFVNNDGGGNWVNGTIGTVTKIGPEIVWVDIPDGDNVIVEPNRWEMYEYYFDEDEEKLAQRSIGSFEQFPLKLAWAMTIHKSQGKTFDRVVIDLGWGSFAHGQTYVALSRCRTLEGITLKNPIRRSDVKLDGRVQSFVNGFKLKSRVKEIQEAIDLELTVEIDYLKRFSEMSQHRIKPAGVGELQQNGRKIWGMKAWCCDEEELKFFYLERIVDYRLV